MAAADGNTNAAPLSDREFRVCLDALGPFERGPLLAVGVSGGADSMALALLADRWASDRGGRVVALTVDHRLRPESAAEARQVGRWLKPRGIAHATLVWDGPHPARDLQAAARAARYRLMGDWCRAHGTLHFLTAHHLEDLAETFWLRLARGSGLDGLAGIAPVTERRHCRMLRPLLDVAPERLRARLLQEGQAWLEDPSNLNRAYARVRIRAARGLLAAEGLGAARLAETMRHLGRARGILEAATAEFLARTVRLHPAGFAWLDPAGLRAAGAEVGMRVLGAVVATIGGLEYPPRLERLERLFGDVVGAGLSQGRTLGGCRLMARRGGILVCREFAGTADPIPVQPGTAVAWDGRIRLDLPRKAPVGLRFGALGVNRRGLPAEARRRLGLLPGPARPTLPALWDRDGPAAVPALEWVRAELEPSLGNLRAIFCPLRPLGPVGFTVV
jgi:tRNA(Ile)-lysidine synthase